MTRRFDDERKRSSRALQIWLILIGKAHNRQTITYGSLADLIGFGGAGTLADMLGHVYYFCQQSGLPPLTILVVNQETGLPGEGLTGYDLNAGREAVFKYDWYSIYPPTVEELETAFAVGNASDGPGVTPGIEVTGLSPGAKAALTRKRREAGEKAAATSKRRAAARKAAATRAKSR